MKDRGLHALTSQVHRRQVRSGPAVENSAGFLTPCHRLSTRESRQLQLRAGSDRGRGCGRGSCCVQRRLLSKTPSSCPVQLLEASPTKGGSKPPNTEKERVAAFTGWISLNDPSQFISWSCNDPPKAHAVPKPPLHQPHTWGHQIQKTIPDQLFKRLDHTRPIQQHPPQILFLLLL